jgi:hypothetical protein
MTETNRQAAIAKHICQDPFAAYLGDEIEAIEPGYSHVSLTVTERGSGQLVAKSQAMVYRKREWFVEDI